MTFKLTNLNVDLINGNVQASINGQSPDGFLGAAHVHVPLKIDGGEHESHLKKRAVEAVKHVLREALQALEQHHV